MQTHWIRFGLVAILAAVPITAAAQNSDYVVSAATWGSAQASAVSAAGGIVVQGNAEAGLAIVRSSRPDFASRLRQSAAIDDVRKDTITRWVDPLVGGIVSGNFTNPPNNDRYFNNIQWAPQAVDAPAAWAEGCKGEGARVAVLDGGIWDVHPDLAPNMDVARSVSFVSGQPFNADVGTFGHGTHVAGIIAAIDNGGDTNSGVIGIAPKATIIGVKVLHDGSGSFGAVIQGILYAATPIWQGGAGADIINMSLGALVPRDDPDARELLRAVRKAVRYASFKGVLVVVAAGNEAENLDRGNLVSVPAESGFAVAVSATGPVGFAYGETDFDRPASYTNFGKTAIDIAAPGGDFVYPTDENCTLPTTNGLAQVRPCWVFDMVFSTNVNGWAWAAGTSMAAPAASAVAALIKAERPWLPLIFLRSLLLHSALDLGKPGKDAFYGRGWVNALEACRQ
jgi:lantibiotic leader peptide-processing serine protease